MSAGGGAENTDPNKQPPAAVSDLLEAAADSAAAQSDASRYLHVRTQTIFWSGWLLSFRWTQVLRCDTTMD